MRTARSRTSGENLFDLVIAPSSQVLEPPQNPGRFTKLEYLQAYAQQCWLTLHKPRQLERVWVPQAQSGP